MTAEVRLEVGMNIKPFPTNVANMGGRPGRMGACDVVLQVILIGRGVVTVRTFVRFFLRVCVQVSGIVNE